MSEDLIMLLIRVAVIVFPAGFACFIAGFLYGRSTAYRAMQYDDHHLDGPSIYDEPMEWTEPAVTRLTSRGTTKEI